MGVRHVQTGVLTWAKLLVNFYLAQLYLPLKSIGNQVTSMQRSLASAERAFSLLNEAPDVVEQKQAGLSCLGWCDPLQRLLRIHRDHHVLQTFPSEAPPGTRVGIAGRTGAGNNAPER